MIIGQILRKIVYLVRSSLYLEREQGSVTSFGHAISNKQDLKWDNLKLPWDLDYINFC